MRRFAASDVAMPIAFNTLAQHDMQKLEIGSVDGHRLDAAGNLLFHVQWRGFTVAEASFEPATQITECAEGAVYTYCAQTSSLGTFASDPSASLITYIMLSIDELRRHRASRS